MNDIPTKFVKVNKDIHANFITEHFNYYITWSKFPDELKHADVVPVQKKNEKGDKKNYRSMKKVTKKLQTCKHSDQNLENVWKIYV